MKKISVVLVIFILTLLVMNRMYNKEYENLQQLLSIGKGIGKRDLFTPSYKIKIQEQLTCLNPSYVNEIIASGNPLKEDEDLINLIKQLINDFAIQEVNYEVKRDTIRYDLSLNLKKPFRLNVELIKSRDYVLINDIKNLCELFDYINFYRTLPIKDKSCQ